MAEKKRTVKSLLKGPLPYVAVGALVVVIGVSLLTSGGFRPVTTQEGLELLQDNQVESATIIDGEQRVDLELRSSYEGLGTQVQFYYVAPRGGEIVQAVTESDVGEFTDEVPQTNWFISFLGLIFPFILIGLIFWFLLSSM
ncbi:MAG: cell division protein FtsH, partial [Microbacteriaceae bacterium]|nr:cell division protein FtsH [Microbacteriaceae bacterium]